jgi:hypothetical protein
MLAWREVTWPDGDVDNWLDKYKMLIELRSVKLRALQADFLRLFIA